ncbi:MAG: hypothetical protein H6737_03405 [Alphaproteobacteria bacterium]|nr:hypothetical protein [Alphaproteobacteria bacterium]
MLEFLALLIGITLPVSIVYVIFRRGKRQLDAAIAYRQVAMNLGLNVDTRGVSVQGHLGDRRLWVGEVLLGHGPDRQITIWGVVDMQRPLGLGLQVRRRGLSERVFRRGTGRGVELGDELLDKRIEALGDDPNRVRGLLGDRDVKSALQDLMARWPDIVVTDYSVRVHLKTAETSERGLQGLVDGMLRLAAALEVARRQVPVPDRLVAASESWGALAAELGCELEPWLPAVVGELDGRRLLLTAWRADQGYQGDLRMYFRPHRELGLRIRHQVEPDGYWSVGQDIQLDDPGFDKHFVIKGWDPMRVKALLGPEARKALLAAQECGNVHIDDERLHLRDLPLEADRVKEAIARATQLAEALGW